MKDVGVLFDLAAVNPRHGAYDVEILRWARGSSLRFIHRWIHLVLFSLDHHPRSRRYLDGELVNSVFLLFRPSLYV